MKIAFARIIEAATESLTQDVIPHVQDDYARGQVFAVISILKTLGMRSDWSPEIYLAQIRLQQQAISRVSSMLSRYGVDFASGKDERDEAYDVGELMARVESGNQQIISILRWLHGNKDRLPQDDLSSVQTTLEEAMKALNELEWRLVAPQTLAQISGSDRLRPPGD